MNQVVKQSLLVGSLIFQCPSKAMAQRIVGSMPALPVSVEKENEGKQTAPKSIREMNHRLGRIINTLESTPSSELKQSAEAELDSLFTPAINLLEASSKDAMKDISTTARLLRKILSGYTVPDLKKFKSILDFSAQDEFAFNLEGVCTAYESKISLLELDQLEKSLKLNSK